MMLDVMRLRFKAAAIMNFERFFSAGGLANVSDFFPHQARVWSMSQDEQQPPQIVHAGFSIYRDVLDLVYR